MIFHIDNMVTCDVLNNSHSSAPDLMFFVRLWGMLIELNNLAVAPVYIATHLNIDADDLSRMRLQQFKDRNMCAKSCMT